MLILYGTLSDTLSDTDPSRTSGVSSARTEIKASYLNLKLAVLVAARVARVARVARAARAARVAREARNETAE